VAAAWKIVLLVVEERSKASILKPQYAEYPPETEKWSLNRATFWWMNFLFFKGFKSLLSLRDLFVIEISLISDALFQKCHTVLHYYVGLVPWH